MLLVTVVKSLPQRRVAARAATSGRASALLAQLELGVQVELARTAGSGGAALAAGREYSPPTVGRVIHGSLPVLQPIAQMPVAAVLAP